MQALLMPLHQIASLTSNYLAEYHNMKRLNPLTGEPFKSGDIRGDGLIFRQYNKTKIKNDGFFAEQWITSKVLENCKDSRSSYLKTVKGRARTLFDSAKNRCRKNNGKVTITKDWIENVLKDGVCQLTGLPFDYASCEEGRYNPYSPSLDRIDSNNRDYSPENTRIVLTAVNLALNSFGMNVMRPIFKKLIDQ